MLFLGLCNEQISAQEEGISPGRGGNQPWGGNLLGASTRYIQIYSQDISDIFKSHW